MTNQPGTSTTAPCINLRLFPFASALLCALIVLAIPCLQAQTLHVLYQLTDTTGSNPNGLILDAGGNLYGTMGGGPAQYTGSVFELKRAGSNWRFQSLYNFKARDDGSAPRAPVVFGQDGALYGTTLQGTFFNFCWYQVGPCGTAFSLQPSSNPCGSALCAWDETHLYWFGGSGFLGDGYNPGFGPVVFDADGNIYGTTVYGGLYGKGTAYELVKTQSGWAEQILDNFQGNDAPQNPYAGLTFDSAGNLYGTAAGGQYGLVYELVHSDQGWTEKVLYRFQGGSDGANPMGGLTFDSAGNAYGTTYGGYQTQQATVFELSPQADGTWRKTVLELLPGNGSINNLTMDAAGNLYGTTTGTPGINDDHYGMVFKLSQVGGSWMFTQLHEFAVGDEGVFPDGSVAVDAAGNVYGSCTAEGANLFGTIWELTP